MSTNGIQTLVSGRSLAKMVGVSEASIRKARDAGYITSYDPDTKKYRIPEALDEYKLSTTRSSVSPTAELQKHKAETEKLKAALLKLKLQSEEGESIPRGLVKSTVSVAFKTFKSQIMSLCDTLPAILALEQDQNVIYDILHDRLSDSFNELQLKLSEYNSSKKKINKEVKDLLNLIISTIRPVLRLNISEWSQKNRILPVGYSAYPGKWNNDLAPYLIDIMNALSRDDPTQEVVVMKGAQLGLTEAALNLIGYTIDCNPSSIFYVMPTEALASDFSRTKLRVLFENTEALKSKLYNDFDSARTILMKSFSGGYLKLVGANSPSSLSSASVQIMIFDEVDRYPLDLGGEGNPVEIGKKRADTFPNKKIFMLSTPGEAAKSLISPAYDTSDQRRYHVVCPYCKFSQPLEWSNLKFEYSKNDYTLIDEPMYMCVNCGVLIPENKKRWMISPENGAKWIPTKKSKIRGYHLSSLYSNWVTWKDLVEEFLRARYEQVRGKNEFMKVFQTTRLATPYMSKAELSAKSIDDLRVFCDDRPRSVVPSLLQGSLCLVMGCDVQQNVIYYVVRAYKVGDEMASWLIQEGTVSDLEDLTYIWQADYFDASGRVHKIKRAAIDSGYRTDAVYKYCLKYKAQKICFPIKGSSDNSAAPYRFSDIGKQMGGRKSLSSWDIIMFNTRIYKEIIMLKLAGEVDQVGAFMFYNSDEIADNYLEQISSEYLNDKGVYVLRRGFRDNHYLDCEVYALGIADAMKIFTPKRNAVKKTM